jgi:hypothetical protein
MLFASAESEGTFLLKRSLISSEGVSEISLQESQGK